MTQPLTPTELEILTKVSMNKKRRHVAGHIGRDISDADWQAVLDARKSRDAEWKRRETIREQRRAAREVKPMIPAWQRLKWRREAEARQARMAADAERLRLEVEQAEVVNKTLKRAARIARAEGFEVRKSTDRNGRVSSYYAKRRNMRPIRISDHELPMTDKRQCMRDLNGGASAFQDEIIIDGELSPTRIKRMLALAEAGRLWDAMTTMGY